MGCLATVTVLSSLRNNSRSTPLARHHASGVRRIDGAPPPLQKSLNKKRQPSVAEVRKAIGAGVQQHDNDSSIKRGDSAFMDMMLSSPFAQPEGSAERKLREVGEWVIDRTEKSPRSGQHILMALCLKILPVWLLLLLITSGLIKLPFEAPFLDDLIM
ncbi:hypothetical protein AAC387_Pa12g0472 [Persea americana]